MKPLQVANDLIFVDCLELFRLLDLNVPVIPPALSPWNSPEEPLHLGRIDQ